MWLIEFLRGNGERVLDLLPDVSGLLRLEHDEDAARFVLDAVEGHHVVVGLPVQLREVRLDDVVALLEKVLLLGVLYDRQGMTRSCSTWTTTRTQYAEFGTPSFFHIFFLFSKVQNNANPCSSVRNYHVPAGDKQSGIM